MVKNLSVKAGDARDSVLIPGLGRSPGEGNGNPLQYSCLENPMDGGTWCATGSWGHKESDKMKHTYFPLEGLLHPGGCCILPGIVTICP